MQGLFRKLILSKLILFSSVSTWAFAENSFEWNPINVGALAVMSCGLHSEKSETLHYHEQLLFHELHIEELENENKIRITGECAKPVNTQLKMQKGDEIQFEIDLREFAQKENPVLMAIIGSWGIRFYFKSISQYDGSNLRVVKILDRVSYFSVGTSAARSLINGVGLLSLTWYGSESLSPMKFSVSGSWQHSDGRTLDLEGLGSRNAEAIRIWSQEKRILMNAAGLVGYWARGEGRPTGESGDAIFFPRSSMDSTLMGCSYFVESQHRPLTEDKCRELWKQAQ